MPANTENKKTYYVEFSIAIIAFLGAVIGAKMGTNSNLDLWEKEKLFSSRSKLLDKRLELYERTVQILNKKNDADLLQSKIDVTKKVMDLKIDYIKSKDAKEEIRNKDIFAKDELFEDATQNRQELFRITNEFATVMSLDAVFFGDSTKSVITNFKKINPWWSADSLQCHNLLAAMYYDLFLDNKY